jgi:hypothetical protein
MTCRTHTVLHAGASAHLRSRGCLSLFILERPDSGYMYRTSTSSYATDQHDHYMTTAPRTRAHCTSICAEPGWPMRWAFYMLHHYMHTDRACTCYCVLTTEYTVRILYSTACYRYRCRYRRRYRYHRFRNHLSSPGAGRAQAHGPRTARRTRHTAGHGSRHGSRHGRRGRYKNNLYLLSVDCIQINDNCHVSTH